MLPAELVRLTALMERTSGIPEVKIGLVESVFRRVSRLFSALPCAADSVIRSQLVVAVYVFGSVPMEVRGPALHLNYC